MHKHRFGPFGGMTGFEQFTVDAAGVRTQVLAYSSATPFQIDEISLAQWSDEVSTGPVAQGWFSDLIAAVVLIGIIFAGATGKITVAGLGAAVVPGFYIVGAAVLVDCLLWKWVCPF